MWWMPYSVRTFLVVPRRREESAPSQPPANHALTPAPGFSFSGEVREPFPAVIRAMEETGLPVTSVDAPSSWDIETGPPESGVGSSFSPAVLVSLTAPKSLVKFFKGRHFVGGRCAPSRPPQNS